jgi:hypothetical protein
MPKRSHDRSPKDKSPDFDRDLTRPGPDYERLGREPGFDRDADSPPDADREAPSRRESGEPGGGQGRRDRIDPTGVYPLSAGIPEGKQFVIRTPAEWGQGDRGAAGYEDAGSSELHIEGRQGPGSETAGGQGNTNEHDERGS